LTRCHTLVLGIGNTLLSDEGAGVHALEYLRSHYPDIPGVHYLDGGTLSFTLAGEIEDAENLIVIDAAQLGAPAGTVRCMTGKVMDRFLGQGKRSARLTEAFPRHRALIGIQPDVFGWGEAPSTPVCQAFPEVAAQALNLIEQWGCSSD
jgi:hydrogenase maturation protease